MELTTYDITIFVYNLSLIPIIFFSVLFILLSILSLLVKKDKPFYKRVKDLPFITVQIPTYNDPVAERCVLHCMKFDYPKDKYEILIADDSTNLETQNLLHRYAEENKGFVKYIHRENRENFKPGALSNAMKFSKGEFIVIFDADWMPAPDFLKRAIEPFTDPNVAIVQTRQGVYNQNTNLITRFASYILTIYHYIIMPINNRVNCVFFCGTAGVIRRSTYEEVGGWNINSLTEDADLTVNVLLKGYKTVYLEFETPSEVPDTFEGFIKQQMRWCYGNVRVFIDNSFKILFEKTLTFKQRLMIMYITLGNVIAPIVVVMTFFGIAGWFLGEINLFRFNDVITFFVKFFYTSGFILMGIITLYKRHQLKELPYFLISGLTVGIITAVANSVAFAMAVVNRKLHWFCTPKVANNSFIENESS